MKSSLLQQLVLYQTNNNWWALEFDLTAGGKSHFFGTHSDQLQHIKLIMARLKTSSTSSTEV